MTPSDWIREDGQTGTIEVYHSQGGNLTLLDEASDSSVRVSIAGPNWSVGSLSDNQAYRMPIEVDKYVFGMNDDKDRLLATIDGTPSKITDRQGARATAEKSNPSGARDRDDTLEVRNLAQLDGDGSRVILKVWVASTSDHGSDKVIQTGNLADHSVDHTPRFIIFDDPGVRKLQWKGTYELRNVKDNYYEEQDQKQVIIDGQSEILSWRPAADPPDSLDRDTDRSPSSRSSADLTAAQLDEGLDPWEAPDDVLDDRYWNR